MITFVEDGAPYCQKCQGACRRVSQHQDYWITTSATNAASDAPRTVEYQNGCPLIGCPYGILAPHVHNRDEDGNLISVMPSDAPPATGVTNGPPGANTLPTLSLGEEGLHESGLAGGAGQVGLGALTSADCLVCAGPCRMPDSMPHAVTDLSARADRAFAA